MRKDAHVNPRLFRAIILLAALLLAAIGASRAAAAEAVATPIGNSSESASKESPSLPIQLPDLTKKENLSSAMQIVVMLTVLSLAPAILIMMTSFTRIVIVLSLLRQALGTQQLPPNQVLIGLSLFMTFLVMGPTFKRVNEEALRPYMRGEFEQREALGRAIVPLREFMIGQIENAKGEENVLMLQ